MISAAAENFEFKFTTFDGAENRSAAGGGGEGGKVNPPDLPFTKFIEFSDSIDDLSGSTGGEAVTVGLLLPAVQSVREAARSTKDTSIDELQISMAAEDLGDWFLG